MAAMRRLFHMPLDPASRMIRIALAEKGLPAQFEAMAPWSHADEIAAANPAGTIPVLIEEDEEGAPQPLSPASAVMDYLEERYPDPAIFPGEIFERAEIRRLVLWFTEKFEIEVISMTVRERIDKRAMRQGQPDYDVLRAGINALDWHMDYFEWLLEKRSWFAGEYFSAADIAAAAYLSCLDYVDAIAWPRFSNLKEWYARVKCRPSFRPILRDRTDIAPPPRHYDDLDF